MRYLPGLAAALAGFWFLLSGQGSPLFIGLAVVSVGLVLTLTARLSILDRDASPYHRSFHLAGYIGWLIVEIVKAHAAFIAVMFRPKHTIDPVLLTVRTTARTDLAKALFASSVTLTPGTLTLDTGGDKVRVHALTREQSQLSCLADMDRRAVRAADRKT